MSVGYIGGLGVAGLGIPEYEEYGWVCAPNAAGQSITANTITTLTLTDRVSAASFGGSIGSNQVTLPAGTYYFEADVQAALTAGCGDVTLSLFNVSDSSYITRKKFVQQGDIIPKNVMPFIGQFSISSTKIIDVRVNCGTALTVGRSDSASYQQTSSTAGADQRTTLKLWRAKENLLQSTLTLGGGGGGYTSYGEWAWRCAPNTAGQSITANTPTTLTLDTEIQDISGIGSISSNQVTLTAGSYYFEAETTIQNVTAAGMVGAILSLYNVSDSSYICGSNDVINANGTCRVRGSFTLSSSKIVDLRLLATSSGGTLSVRSGAYNTAFTDATANADQRTTLKVWKK